MPLKIERLTINGGVLTGMARIISKKLGKASFLEFF